MRQIAIIFVYTVYYTSLEDLTIVKLNGLYLYHSKEHITIVKLNGSHLYHGKRTAIKLKGHIFITANGA